MKVLVFILFLSCYACKEEKINKGDLVAHYYNEKKDQLEEERRLICEALVLEEAQAQIDSLIDTWVNAELFDTLQFPPKPIKPIKPEAILDLFQKFSLDSIED